MAYKRMSSGEGGYGPQPCRSWDPWQRRSLVTEGPYPDAVVWLLGRLTLVSHFEGEMFWATLVLESGSHRWMWPGWGRQRGP